MATSLTSSQINTLLEAHSAKEDVEGASKLLFVPGNGTEELPEEQEDWSCDPENINDMDPIEARELWV